MKTQDKLLRILILIASLLVVLCTVATIVLFSVSRKAPPADGTDTDTETGESGNTQDPSTGPETDTSSLPASVLLPETADKGLDYQNRLYFFGESTTAHLKSRGVLTGGKSTKQVFHPNTNTLQIQNACSTKLRYLGDSTEEDTIGNIVKKVKPEYLVLCFGLNGVEKFSSGETGKKLFVTSYQSLIDEIRKNSPDTRIILESIYPVASGCTDFKADAATINSYLKQINEWTMELARKNGLKFCDAASAVTGKDGFLDPAYAMSDGVHITAEGYKQVLAYFRTHAYPD